MSALWIWCAFLFHLAVCMCVCNGYLSHNSDWGLSFSLCHSVLYQVVHVLVVQQADQVKGTKTGRTSQGQVSDHHGAVKQRWWEWGNCYTQFLYWDDVLCDHRQEVFLRVLALLKNKSLCFSQSFSFTGFFSSVLLNENLQRNWCFKMKQAFVCCNWRLFSQLINKLMN